MQEAGMAELTDELAACRAMAGGDLLRRMPRADLHALIARCMAIAERCERDQDELSALHAAVRVVGNGATGRRYVETETDSYLIVCRYVFAQDRGRGWRYAAVMREAAKRQIGSAGLPQWCAMNGGMNALFLSRPLDRKTVSSKTIRLTEAVAMPKHGSVTLTLRRMPDGLFSPVSVALADAGGASG
jgi:hypothetical protein